MNKITCKTIKDMKNKDKITIVTAYDYTSAKLLDESGIDAILVGDSLGNVILGYDDTTMVTMEDMEHHTRAVARGAKNALIIADMPFLSYHIGIEKTVENAGRLIRAGAGCVKLEGGNEILPQVNAILNAGIPIMAHLGFTPQSVNKFGGYLYQGKSDFEATKLIEDAKALEDAGVFSIVLECVPKDLARVVSKTLKIPTIGIGAGNLCDGQVLVYHDMFGLYSNYVPSFVKQYAGLGDIIRMGAKEYIKEVKSGAFPLDEHTKM